MSLLSPPSDGQVDRLLAVVNGCVAGLVAGYIGLADGLGWWSLPVVAGVAVAAYFLSCRIQKGRMSHEMDGEP